MTWQQLLESNPEVIVALPCGFDLARMRSEMATLTRLPEWPGLRGANGPSVRDGWESVF